MHVNRLKKKLNFHNRWWSFRKTSHRNTEKSRLWRELMNIIWTNLLLNLRLGYSGPCQGTPGLFPVTESITPLVSSLHLAGQGPFYPFYRWVQKETSREKLAHPYSHTWKEKQIGVFLMYWDLILNNLIHRKFCTCLQEEQAHTDDTTYVTVLLPIQKDHMLRHLFLHLQICHCAVMLAFLHKHCW